MKLLGNGNEPCRADDDVAGASAKASRSRRTEDDCLRAELKREFCGALMRKYLAEGRKGVRQTIL